MEKLATLLFIAFTIQLNAQCKLIKDDIDDFTGDTIKVTKQALVGYYGSYYLKSSVGRVNQQHIIYFNFSGDMGCVSGDSYVIVKFKDGTTEQFDHQGDVDCSTGASLIVIFDKEQMTKPVEKIRVSHSQNYADVDVRKETFFIEAINCIQ
jgi:hypothetical protein